MSGVTLAVENITVDFGGHRAVDDVSFVAKPGHITGLIGPNGAGKTTLFNAITGLLRPSRGRVVLDGHDITGQRAHQRAQLGLARTFQRLELFTLLSVRDNVAAAVRTSRLDPDELLERVGLGGLGAQRVDSLPTGQARLVELARALATSPKVLLLDEPASGLTEDETDRFGALLRGLAGGGLTVVLVEHDVPLVMDVCDHIHVLDFGELIASGSPAEVQADPAVTSAYLGAAPAIAAAPHRSVADADAPPLLELTGVRAGYGLLEVLHGVNLQVPAGAITALLGPNGAGKSTTLAIASGFMMPTAGEVRMAGRRVDGAHPDALARAGVCTIPEGKGVFPNLTVRENLLMATHRGVPMASIEAVTYERFPQLAARRNQVAGTMSGGEQQMLAMARALGTDPALLLLDELSMGLAPIIVAELYELVAQIAESGVGVLVVEQFARTVLPVAHAAAIMVHGHVTSAGAPADIEAELATAYLGAT